MHMGISQRARECPQGLIQNPPTQIIRDYETDVNSDTDSVAELKYKAGEDAARA